MPAVVREPNLNLTQVFRVIGPLRAGASPARALLGALLVAAAPVIGLLELVASLHLRAVVVTPARGADLAAPLLLPSFSGTVWILGVLPIPFIRVPPRPAA